MEGNWFKRAELCDQEVIEEYFRKYPSQSCERTFVNVFLWSRRYPVTWAVVHNALVFKSEDENHLAYAFPAGEEEDIQAALEEMAEYSRSQGYAFRLYNVTKENFEQLEKWYPNKYELELRRDDADYVYEAEKLSTLAGKKLHGKRNHINKFKAVYDGRWCYESMTEKNLEECFQMAMKWRNENDCEEDENKVAEMAVTMNSLRLFKELRLTGGVLKIDDKVVAFTLGEKLSDDMFVVHIEKAFAEIPGAYPMINQQFITNECMDYQYINREEDTGAEGLRKAKLSYRPAFLVEKGTVQEKEN